MSAFIVSSDTMDHGDDDDGIIFDEETTAVNTQDTSTTVKGMKAEEVVGNKNKNAMANIIEQKLNLINKQDMERSRSLPTKQKSLQFLHIPKNAGSTITDSARVANIAWGYCRFQMNPNCPSLPIPILKNDEDDIDQEDGKYLNEMLSKVHLLHLNDTNKYLWHYPPSIVIDILQQHKSEVGLEKIVNPYLNTDLFVVVRDPYDRIVSAYYHWETMHHDIEKVNSAGLMNRLIGESLDELERDYHLYRGGHYIPQYHFVYDGSKKEKIVKHIIQFDNFTKEFQHLMKQYNMTISLEDHKVVKRKRNKKATLTKYDINEGNLKRIESIYLDDFREFGFSFLNGTDLTMRTDAEKSQIN